MRRTSGGAFQAWICAVPSSSIPKSTATARKSLALRPERHNRRRIIPAQKQFPINREAPGNRSPINFNRSAGLRPALRMANPICRLPTGAPPEFPEMSRVNTPCVPVANPESITDSRRLRRCFRWNQFGRAKPAPGSECQRSPSPRPSPPRRGRSQRTFPSFRCHPCPRRAAAFCSTHHRKTRTARTAGSRTTILPLRGGEGRGALVLI